MENGNVVIKYRRVAKEKNRCHLDNHVVSIKCATQLATRQIRRSLHGLRAKVRTLKAEMKYLLQKAKRAEYKRVMREEWIQKQEAKKAKQANSQAKRTKAANPRAKQTKNPVATKLQRKARERKRDSTKTSTKKARQTISDNTFQFVDESTKYHSHSTHPQ